MHKTLVAKAAHLGGERHFKLNRRFKECCHYRKITPIASMLYNLKSKGKD